MTVRIPSPYGNLAGAPPELMAAYLRDPRAAAAARSLQEGSSTAPVQSWVEGLARLGQGLWGGYQQGEIGREYGQQADDYRDTLARALKARTPEEREAILGRNSLTQGPALESAIERQERQADREADTQARMLAQGLTYDPATKSFGEAANFSDIMANRKTKELDTEYGAKLKYQPQFDELALGVKEKEAEISAKYDRQLLNARTAAEAGLIAQRRDAEIAANRAKLQDEAEVNGGVGDLFGKGDEMNVILAYGPLIANGTATPDQVNAYNAAAAKFQKPMQVPIPDPNNPGAMMLGMYRPELPQGFPAPGAVGETPTQGAGASGGITPIEGSSKPPSSEQARMVAVTDSALSAGRKVRELIFDKGGNLRRDLLALKALPWQGLSSEAKQLLTYYYALADADIRLRTGTAAPASEIEAHARAMMPDVTDSEQSALTKIEAVESIAAAVNRQFKPDRGGADFAGKVKAMSSDAIRAMDVEALSASDAQAVLDEIQRRKQSGAW